MEMWKLTDATGVYVKPQKHPMRTLDIGQWLGLCIMVDLDRSEPHRAESIHELERVLGMGLRGSIERINHGGK